MKAKALHLLLLLLFLQGCQWPEPYTPIFPAKVSVADNKVCISTTPIADERIEVISIYTVDPLTPLVQEHRLTLPISENECIPDHGITYESGKIYNVVITLVSEKKRKSGIEPAARIFSARFTVNNDNHALAVELN